MTNHVMCLLAALPVILLLGSTPAAAQPTVKTCDHLRAFGRDDEVKAASDGRWARTAVGPVLRDAIIAARVAKRIQAQCAAEGRMVEANTAMLNAESAVVDDFALLVEYLGYRSTLSAIEEKRFDKQMSSPASSAGSTSPTSKGTVPSLIGIAVENGALLKTVSGTTITFQAVPLNVVKALAAHDYVASAPNPQPGTLRSLLSDVSVSVSVDTSRGATPNTFTGDPQQISAFGARYQIINWRDPRSARYAAQWEALRTERQVPLSKELNGVNALLRSASESVTGARSVAPAVKDAYEAWRKATIATIDAASVDDVERVIAAAAAQFRTVVEASPEVMAQIARAGAALSDYFLARKGTLDVAKSLVLAFEYSGTKQAPTAATPAGPGLSTFTLVFGMGLFAKTELTGNVGFTLFNSLPAAATEGRVRDVRAAAQLDVPLPEIQNIGTMVFSLSALVDHLRQEPLGQPVVINSVTISSAGTIGLVQAKLTIPTKGTGVAIPISVTLSNRPELVLETTTRTIARLNIGVSLDLDKLFAKP